MVSWHYCIMMYVVQDLMYYADSSETCLVSLQGMVEGVALEVHITNTLSFPSDATGDTTLTSSAAADSAVTSLSSHTPVPSEVEGAVHIAVSPELEGTDVPSELEGATATAAATTTTAATPAATAATAAATEQLELSPLAPYIPAVELYTQLGAQVHVGREGEGGDMCMWGGGWGFGLWNCFFRGQTI